MLLGRKGRKSSVLKKQVTDLEQEVERLKREVEQANAIIARKDEEIKRLETEIDESKQGILKLPGNRARPNMKLVDSILYRTSYYGLGDGSSRILSRQASTGLIGTKPRKSDGYLIGKKSLWNRKNRSTSISASGGATLTQTTQAVVLSGLLAKIGLFAEFDAYERLSLAKRFELREYKAGEFLIRKNQVGNRFFVLVDGQVGVFISVDGPDSNKCVSPYSATKGSVTDGFNTKETSKANVRDTVTDEFTKVADNRVSKVPKNRFLTLSPGDHFGESVLIRGAAQTASVVATTDTVTCLTISRSEFKDMLECFESSAVANTRAFLKHTMANQSAVEGIRNKVATAFSKEEYLASVAMLEGYTLELASDTNNTTASNGSIVAAAEREIDYVQVLKDIMREPSMIVNGQVFQVADVGEEEYSRFLEFLTQNIVELVQHLNSEVGEVEASQLVVEVLKRCTRTTSGGDAYMQCNLLMGNPELVFFTPVAEHCFSQDSSSDTETEPESDEEDTENTRPLNCDTVSISITVQPNEGVVLLKSKHRFRINHLEPSGTLGTEFGLEDEQVWAVVEAELTERLTFSCVKGTQSSKSNPAAWLQSIFHKCKRELRIVRINPVAT